MSVYIAFETYGAKFCTCYINQPARYWFLGHLVYTYNFVLYINLDSY